VSWKIPVTAVCESVLQWLFHHHLSTVNFLHSSSSSSSSISAGASNHSGMQRVACWFIASPAASSRLQLLTEDMFGMSLSGQWK